MDPKLKKWIKSLRIIENEVTELLVNNDIFTEVQQIVKKSKDIQEIPSSFYGYFKNTYVSDIIMRIRRQIKTDSNSISLAGLLTDISKYPEILSRKYYKTLYKNKRIRTLVADEHFDRWSGKGKVSSSFISKKMVDDDLRNLRKSLKKCEKFADKRIAHIDKKKIKDIPSFKDASDCIDVLDKMCVKYKLIFHAASTSGGTLMPTYQYDWKKIFKYPWISD